ncbi:carbohydrate ABC transporter permease [Microbacterium betulae]|uniref:Carbohydrate ABC transporter permease n=1 Tax=Microbacterium betulae TaxID=2981139 RepID=A0AA97FHM7_9MICO|nr:carbohydrate ABC transporter permease [Microbacterium sp. AB]WOF23185.1 carbohydrate ABC transporter permease [Microbacterium sp. AB]
MTSIRLARRPARVLLASSARHVVLLVAAVVFAGPFAWMVLTSFKSTAEAISFPPAFLPEQWRFDNYVQLFEAVPFGRYYLNSLVVAAVAATGQVVTSLAAGYAFSRLTFRGKNVLFVVLLCALMVPFEIVFTPLVDVIATLGWMNTYQGLIVPNIPSALGIYLFRSFFDGFPGEIEDAARIDGASVLRRLRSVAIPVATPMIGSFAILSFVYNWNNFFFQYLVVNRTDMFTVQLGLTQLQAAQGGTDFSLLMAGSTLAVVPVLVVFLLFHKRIITAISGGLR